MGVVVVVVVSEVRGDEKQTSVLAATDAIVGKGSASEALFRDGTNPLNNEECRNKTDPGSTVTTTGGCGSSRTTDRTLRQYPTVNSVEMRQCHYRSQSTLVETMRTWVDDKGHRTRQWNQHGKRPGIAEGLEYGRKMDW